VNRLPGIVAIVAALLASSADYPAAIAYFSNLRQVKTVPAQAQNYIALDDSVWAHARADLGDLRLYDGETQVPYALRELRGGIASVAEAVKILNLATTGGHTEFDLDTGGGQEYNRIELQLAAKDFVNRARIEGRNQLNAPQGAHLGSSTLYDFTRENLGRSVVLRLPLSSFQYVHVRLDPGITAEQVQVAVISKFEEKKAAWRVVGACQPSTPRPKATVLACTLPDALPVERIACQIPSESVNFRRSVQVENAAGTEMTRGEISRIRIARAGQMVVEENLAIDLPSPRSSHFTVVVENGDDAPLPFQAVQVISVERRLYFNPQGKPSLRLYFGDPKLEAPTYDYDKFFREDAAAAQADLGPDEHNSAYTGRPDDRPWSERHKVVLWLVMVLAVAALLAVAVRGLRASPRPA